MELLLIKIVHFLRRNYLVVIEIDYTEPVVQRLHRAFVLFAEHKVNKIFVAHFTRLLSFELARHLIKDAIDSFATQCMTLVTTKVFFVYYEIMV